MISEKLNILYSLAFNCPFNLGCFCCPFEEIWRMDIDERIEYIEKLNPSEMDELIKLHYKKYGENFDFHKHSSLLNF